MLVGAELNSELAKISRKGKIEEKHEPPTITKIDFAACGMHPESRSASNVVGFLRQAARALTSRRSGFILLHSGVCITTPPSQGSEFGIPFCNTSLHPLILSYSSLCSRLLCPRLSTHCLSFEYPVVSVSRYWHRCFCPHWRLLHSPSQSTGPQQLCPFATLRSSSTGTVRSHPLLKRMRSRARRCSATTPTIGPEGSSYSILCPILKR